MVNAKQERAIELILRGETDREVCKKVGVTRETVNKWRNHDTEFCTELTTRRSLVWERQRDKLAELSQLAMDVLQRAMNNPDEKVRIRAALVIAKIPVIQDYLKLMKPLPKEEPSVLDILAQALEGVDVTPKWLEKEGQSQLAPPTITEG